jgi:hypothetical protein
MCFNIRTGENINGAPFGKRGYGVQKLYPVRVSDDGENIEAEVELETDFNLPPSQIQQQAVPNEQSQMQSEVVRVSKENEAGAVEPGKPPCSFQ